MSDHSHKKNHKRDRHDYDSDEAERKHKKKEKKKVEKVAKLLGYSNEINPFGDSSLLTPFVWGKKKEEGKGAKPLKSNSNNNTSEDAEDESKQLKLMAEIEKARKRRQDRETELAEMDRLRDEEQRMKELASLGDWQKKEEEFHLEQTKERSIRRLVEHREHPMDCIMKNMLMIDACLSIRTAYEQQKKYSTTSTSSNLSSNTSSSSSFLFRLQDVEKSLTLLCLPLELLNPLEIIQFSAFSLPDLRQLLDEIDAYRELDTKKYQGEYSEFFNSLRMIVIYKIKHYNNNSNNSNNSNNHSSKNTNNTNNNHNSSNSLHESISEDVASLLQGKTAQELNALEEDIRMNLQMKVDVEYWEVMLEEVTVQRAQLLVNKEHHIAILQRLQGLLQRMKEEGIVNIEEYRRSRYSNNNHNNNNSNNNRHNNDHRASGAAGGQQQQPKSADELALEAYLRDAAHEGGSGGGGGGDVEETEMKMLETDEYQLASASSKQQQQMSSKDADEEAAELVLAGIDPKYRPRKPRYFNRVKTGWDRNKYNLTHYDYDNPPPKRIQGYKFTIFYPDLIDKTKAPRYFLERCADDASQEFVIIRFHAGPPYEDIAFKIVNREWDTFRRAGFINDFDRGIMRLHFNFKKTFYRR